ncbi:MAG: DUF4136 domain-containing protein [Chloracidobacterium sp.]|nr:DUF4136 domain-containing protein [Chloracidobacterium sp.]
MRTQQKIYGFLFGGTLLVVVFFLFGIAVSGQTNSDLNEEFSFSRVKTWNFMTERVTSSDKFGSNEIWDNNIRESLTVGLAKAGFIHSDTSPDLMIRYRLSTKEKQSVNVIRDNWDYAYHRGERKYWRVGGRRRGTSTVYRTAYDQSTLVLDIVDVRTKELVWRGYDRRSVDDKSEKSLKKSVDKLMDRFAKDVRESLKTEEMSR